MAGNIIDDLRTRIEQIFVGGLEYWQESPDYMKAKEEAVERLRLQTEEVFGFPASIVITPRNINNYFDVECSMQKSSPTDMTELEYQRVKESGPIEYFQILCSVVAPVSAGAWHRFSVNDAGQWEHEIVDLFDNGWLESHPSHEGAILKLSEAAEGLHLSIVDWDVACRPADAAWPKPKFAPEAPELRHYLFPGYYDDWREVKAVRG